MQTSAEEVSGVTFRFEYGTRLLLGVIFVGLISAFAARASVPPWLAHQIRSSDIVAVCRIEKKDDRITRVRLIATLFDNRRMTLQRFNSIFNGSRVGQTLLVIGKETLERDGTISITSFDVVAGSIECPVNDGLSAKGRPSMTTKTIRLRDIRRLMRQ
jgi:hypothetical protein